MVVHVCMRTICFKHNVCNAEKTRAQISVFVFSSFFSRFPHIYTHLHTCEWKLNGSTSLTLQIQITDFPSDFRFSFTSRTFRSFFFLRAEIFISYHLLIATNDWAPQSMENERWRILRQINSIWENDSIPRRTQIIIQIIIIIKNYS